MNAHVKVFDGQSGQEIRSFFAFDGFLGGVSVASADMNGDGYAEIIVGAGEGGGPHVKVFDGKTNAIIESFFAFDQGYKGGIVVAAGDVNGDGYADLAVMGAKSVAPRIKTYNLQTRSLMDGPIGSFFAYDQAYRGRVSLALADVTGDGKAEFLTGADGGHVRAMDQRGHDVTSFFAFGQGFGSAVQVSAVDRSGDGIADLVVGTRDGVSSKVRIFDSATRQTLDDFFAYDPNHKAGVFLAGTL